MTTEPKLIAIIYGADSEPLHILEGEWFDSQPNLSGAENDGYHQISIDIPGLADKVEIRIPNVLVELLWKQQNKEK